MSKSVQELARNGKEPTQEFYYKETIDGKVPLVDVPVIDVGTLTSTSSLSGSKEQLDKLRFALSTWGCFQVINHGIESLDNVHEIMKQFFALPAEEKQKYSRTANSTEGYGNDMVLVENQTIDWTDRLYLTIRPEVQRQFNFWPENPEPFRQLLLEYTMKLQELNEILLKAAARSLDLEERCFLDMYGDDPAVISRTNYYPPCPRPDQILGVKPHADGSVFTFLLQDKEVEGLQFLNDSEWYRVPIIPGALFINAGDQLEIMSNGMFKSPIHRVVTNPDKERITVAVFCIPGSEQEVGPADGLIDETRPKLYKKMKNYVSLFFQNYQHGKRPIDVAKI